MPTTRTSDSLLGTMGRSVSWLWRQIRPAGQSRAGNDQDLADTDRTTQETWQTIGPWIKPILQFGTLCVVTAVTVVMIVLIVVLPAYKNPQARLYTSKLGYATLIRSRGGAFPVEVAYPTRRRFSEPILGEGIMSAKPIMVPIIPIDYITKVHVETGDYVEKGELLAELDTRRAQIKVDSAALAVSTTKAEANRVHIGSAYVLAQERPREDQINLNAARRRMQNIREQQEMYTSLYREGIISRSKFLDLEKDLIDEERVAATAMFRLEMSTKGVIESLQIADNAVEDAIRALRNRQQELEAYSVFAPADGVIERVLISPGEYNQDSGKPGFVIAHDLWFEAHLDQRVINKIKIGDEATIYLEAYSARQMHGRIGTIIPIVTFNMGGPETNRPIRPRGSGGPEWPATFVVHIQLDNQKELRKQMKLVPGMTGFGQITTRRDSIAVPLSSVSALSAGAAFVYIYNEDGTYEPRTVRTGGIEDGFIEILSGLSEEEAILSAGFEILESGDRIEVSNPQCLRTGKSGRTTERTPQGKAGPTGPPRTTGDERPTQEEGADGNALPLLDVREAASGPDRGRVATEPMEPEAER